MIICGLVFVVVVCSNANLSGIVLASNDVSMVPSITWNRTYTENSPTVDSIAQTSDGGFILGANIFPITGNNVALLKVDSLGNLQWTQTYMGSARPLGKWLVQTLDGGYAFAGSYAGNCWLAKVDDGGNMLWNQTYVGPGIGGASALVQTSDGGYALTGGSSVVWLMKTDASGIEQWNKTLEAGTVSSIIQTADGGYAVVGGIGNLPDYLLMKANSTGDLQWTKTYGSADEDFAYSVVQTGDGGYALGGWMWLRSNGGGTNLAIVKADAVGNTQWTQYYGRGQGWAMTQTSDSGFAIAGTSLVKADSSGNEQWGISLQEGNSSANQAYSVIQTQDGGYAVAGTHILFGAHSSQSSGWLAKINLVNSTGPTISPFPSLSSSPTPTQEPSASPFASVTASISSTATPSSAPSLTPSPSIPEFPTWIILPSLIVVGSMVYFAKHRRAKQ